MKLQISKYIFLLIISTLSVGVNAQRFENKFSKPLNVVLDEISKRFDVKLRIDVDTVGKMLPYADFRIRPYSVEESLDNVLRFFDYKYTRQGEKSFKITPYEYMRRTPADGEKMLKYLNSLYNDRESWELRTECLRTEVRRILGIDNMLAKCVKAKPQWSKVRKYNGYSVRNFAIETLPGQFVCGTIYLPLAKKNFPLILCPNGHWADGRYREDEQLRFATLARMGAMAVSYDLHGWGESAFQVGEAAHRTPEAHVIQIMNGIRILDMLLENYPVDERRIGSNGGSGGGSQVVMLSLLDERFDAACPTVSLASHFDGGCPCESGMPVSLACGGTNNAEMMAAFAPKPVCVISDGKDWTASVPTLEFPYLQRIYGFYNATEKVSNVHLPDERHDFGSNKRRAVYDFFAREFKLDISKADESKVTVETREMMMTMTMRKQ